MATLSELKNKSLGGKLTLAQIKQKVGLTSQQLQQPQSFLGKATQVAETIGKTGTDVVLGGIKGAGSTIFGLGQLGQRITQPITGEKITEKPQFLKPQGIAQKVGFTGEQIGEFFLPAGLAAKGVKTLEAGVKASQTGKLMQGASKLMGRSLIGAGEAGAVSLAQQGGLNEEVKRNMLIGGTIPIAGFALKGIAKAGIPIGQKIEKTLIRPTLADLQDGFKVSNIFKYDLGGGLARTEQKTYALITYLSERLKTILSSESEKFTGGKIKVDVRKVLNDTVKEITDKKAQFFGINTKIKNAVNFLNQEIKAVSPNGVVELSDAQMIKRGAGKLGAWQYESREPDANALEKVANAFYTKLRLEIERVSPENIRIINKQLSELIPIEKALIRRIPVAERKNIINLSDAVTAIPGLLNSANWWLFALNRILKSGNVANALVKIGSEPVARGPIRTLIFGAGKSLK